MSRYILSWKVGGEAGFGIKSAGLIFAKMCNRAGYEVFGYDEYPSLIRGGHNTYQVTISGIPVSSAAHNIDILVALNTETFMRHTREFNHGGVILYDKSSTPITLTDHEKKLNIKLVNVPFEEITKQAKGPIVMRNIAALGATQALLGLPLSLLMQVIRKTFGHKSGVLEANIKASRLGYEYI